PSANHLRAAPVSDRYRSYVPCLHSSRRPCQDVLATTLAPHPHDLHELSFAPRYFQLCRPRLPDRASLQFPARIPARPLPSLMAVGSASTHQSVSTTASVQSPS